MKKIKFTLFLLGTFDYLIIPLLIFFLSFDPLFAQGHIVPIDDGQHLGWVNSLSHGKVPYRDIFMLYGPLLEYIPLLLMKLFGYSIAVLRAFYHFGMIIGLLLSYFLARIVLKTRLFIYIAALLLVATKISAFWSARWGGPRVALAIAVIILLMLYIRHKRKSLIYFSGFMSAVTFFTSQEIGLCIFFASFLFIIGCNIAEAEFKLKEVFRQAGVYSLGALTLILPFTLYFIFTGAIGSYLKISFFDIPFRFSKIFVDAHPLGLLLKGEGFNYFEKTVFLNRTFLFFLSIIIYAIGLGLFLSRILKKRFKKDDLPLLFLIAFGGPLFLTAQRALWGMQFNMVAPPIIILGCLLMERSFFKKTDSFIQSLKLFFMPPQGKININLNAPCPCGSGKKYKRCCIEKERIRGRERFLWISRVTITISLVGLFFYLVLSCKSPEGPRLSIREKIKNYGKVTGLGLSHGLDFCTTREEAIAIRTTGWSPLGLDRAKDIYVPREQQDIIQRVVYFLKPRLSVDESILVFPHNGHYYFLLDRTGPSRFVPLIYATISPEYQKEVIEDLERDKTRYIIYVKDAYMFTDFKKVPNEERLNKIFEYIKENYIKEARFGETYILKRKP